MVSATEIARMDPHGPSTMAAIATPTAWPVVPPGKGKLNIMTTKENAAKRDSRGTACVFNRRFIFCSETYQNGVAPAYKVAQVEGLRYPSGICMLLMNTAFEGRTVLKISPR